MTAVEPNHEAEAAWEEHSIGFTWRDEEQRYGEYRAFLAGFGDVAAERARADKAEAAIRAALLADPDIKALSEYRYENLPVCRHCGRKIDAHDSQRVQMFHVDSGSPMCVRGDKPNPLKPNWAQR